MGASYGVYGIKKPDERFYQMKKIYDACMEADVELPGDVYDYFDGDEPDNKGVVCCVDGQDYVKKYHNDGRSVYDVDLSKLPKDIAILRFEVSY